MIPGLPFRIPGGRIIGPLWAITVAVLAVAGFAFALFLSYRDSGNPQLADLRTPAVLAVDALLATIVALAYATQQGTLATAAGWGWSVAFGLWIAAAFRIVPPVMNDGAMFFANFATADVPYVIIGAIAHGFIVVLLSIPYMRRIAPMDERRFVETDALWQLGGASILAFLIVAAVVRLQAENLWRL